MLKIRFCGVLFVFVAIVGFINTTFSHAAGLTTEIGSAFNVNDGIINLTDGDITNAGTLRTSTGKINLAGNWTNTGAFNAGVSGTVAFTGTTISAITGANTFANFTCTQPGKQLSFGAGKTQTIGGTWTLTGASGILIKLRSTVPGTQWQVNPTGTKNISFVTSVRL